MKKINSQNWSSCYWKRCAVISTRPVSQISAEQVAKGLSSTTSSAKGVGILAAEIVEENLYRELLIEEAEMQADLSWFTAPGTWG